MNVADMDGQQERGEGHRPDACAALRVAPLQQDYYTVKCLYAQVGILTDR
jgi:hypothetical protein